VFLIYFSTLNSNTLELLCHSFRVTEFFKMRSKRFSFFFLVTLTVHFKLVGALYFTLNYCGHENLIITKTPVMSEQSQTAKLCKLRHLLTFWDMKLAVSSV